jgi:hypothetical protein
MTPVVIDTNVLLVANGSHQDVSGKCREACVSALLARQRSGMVVIDDGYRILGEYGNRTYPNQPKGVGDAFLKWLLQNQYNASRVCRVPITETGPDRFVEFPDPLLEEQFDPPDRKFAAVANAHPAKPPIWQGPTASGWTGGRNWRPRVSWSIFSVRRMSRSFTRRSFRTRAAGLPSQAMSAFFRFPHTPHLAWMGSGMPRDDKVLSSDEADEVLAGPVVVEEKLDGANLGFSVSPDGVLRLRTVGIISMHRMLVSSRVWVSG